MVMPKAKEASDLDNLHLSIRQHEKDVLEKLLSDGIDPDAVFYGLTPLLVAVLDKNIDFVLLLIKYDCDIHKQDVQETLLPFEEVVKGNLVELVDVFIDKGSDINKIFSNGDTPLTYAAKKNYTEMTKTLIKCGADVNIQNNEGSSPLYLLARGGRKKNIEALVVAGADLNMTNKKEEETALVAAILQDHTSAAKYLIQAGSDLNIADSSGWTALRHSVNLDSEALVKVLVAAGADSTIADNQGTTVLQVAIENELEDVIPLLRSGQTISA